MSSGFRRKPGHPEGSQAHSRIDLNSGHSCFEATMQNTEQIVAEREKSLRGKKKVRVLNLVARLTQRTQ